MATNKSIENYLQWDMHVSGTNLARGNEYARFIASKSRAERNGARAEFGAILDANHNLPRKPTRTVVVVAEGRNRTAGDYLRKVNKDL